MANPQVVVDFVSDTSGLQSGFRKSSGAATGFGSKIGGLAKVGAVAAGAAGLGALVATLKIGVSEFAASQKVAAQTAAVLKSTGGAAGVTAKHVSELAESLMKKSGVDDEAIASGENLLLTFTKIRNEAGKGNDIFDQATKATLDLSVALGKDMQSSATLVGKALNDPVKGLTALTKAGVQFTDAQKETIKGMVESGDVMGAQKIILRELNKEFGGSAEAVGKTLPGQLAILRESFNNLAGELVGKLAPALSATIAFLRANWPAISKVIKESWERDVRPALVAFGQLVQAVAGFVREHWGTIGPIVQNMADIVTSRLRIVTEAMKLLAALLRGDWSAAWGALQGIAQAALDNVVAMLRGPQLVLTAAFDLGKKLLAKLKDGLGNVAGMVADKVSAIAGSIGALPGNVAAAARNVGENIYRAVAAGIGSLAGMVRDKVVDIAGGIRGLPGEVAAACARIGNAIFNAIVGGIGDIGGWIIDKIRAGANTAIGMVNGAIGRINSALSFSFHKSMPGPIPDISISIDPPDIPTIPKLARGGIVTGPTLAMVGERGPEAVIPLSGPGGIQVRVFIGDTELRGLVRTEITDQDTRTARTLLAGAH